MNDKKKKFIGFLIFLGIFLVGIPIVATIIINLIESKFNTDLLNLEYIKSTAFSLSTYIKFYNFKMDNPIKLIGYALVIWHIISYLLSLLNGPKSKYEQTEAYGSHGTSRFQEDKEIKEQYYKDDKGWFLGSNKLETYKRGMKAAYHSVNNKLNMQMIVVGPPGSNKTTGFVLPNIFHLCDVYKDTSERPDLIITDPKSELYCLTSEHLRKNDYEVRVLDFIHLKYGDNLNSIDFIKDDKDLMEIAKGYIDAVEYASGGKASGDTAFWNEQEGQVLAALIGFVQQKYKHDKSRQTFTEISKILTSEDVADIESASYFFTNNNIQGAALQFWNNFLMLADSDRTRANILGGLANKLKLFALEGVQNITSSTTIDLSLLGRKKEKPIALFIFMPDGDRTFSPIINVAVSSIFKTLYKTAYKTRNKLEVPVYFILEEMANIGKIPGMQEMLGTMRGRRIYPMMIWQSLSQMKDRYSEGFEDIMSQCDTKVYLGVNDEFTANYCSNSLGVTTIRVQGESGERDSSVFSVKKKSDSNSYNQRKLLMPDEVQRLNNDLLILNQRANNPALLYKTQYKYWEYKLCEEVTLDSIPKFKQNHKVIGLDENENSYKEMERIEAHVREIDKNEQGNKDIAVTIEEKIIEDIVIAAEGIEGQEDSNRNVFDNAEVEYEGFNMDR